jgi:hypothetical protein
MVLVEARPERPLVGGQPIGEGQRTSKATLLIVTERHPIRAASRDPGGSRD